MQPLSTEPALAAEVTRCALPLSRSASAIVADARVLMRRNGRPLGTIEFEAPQQGEQLSSERQNEFKSDLCHEVQRLLQWAAERDFSAPQLRELHVVVSDRYKISKALVPAWSGQSGRMEFPTRRVIARKAAIMHELVHVFFPNGNRLLAEGLAVYLQAEIGSNSAFPNFGRQLHDCAHERLRDMLLGLPWSNATDLEPLHVAELDEIATPGPLTLKVGSDLYSEEPRGQSHIYPIAGSFIQFLIELRGIDSFRKLYDRTPLVPLQQNAGPPDRWIDVYEVSLADLESEWKSLIVGKVKN
jgi:hypothetical protein